MKSFNPWNTAVVLAACRVCGFTEECFPEQPVRARAIDGFSGVVLAWLQAASPGRMGFYIQ